MTIEDILILMVHLYSLGGDEESFSSELEDRFKSLLAENLVSESDHLSEQLQDFGSSSFSLSLTWVSEDLLICFNIH